MHTCSISTALKWLSIMDMFTSQNREEKQEVKDRQIHKQVITTAQLTVMDSLVIVRYTAIHYQQRHQQLAWDCFHCVT